MTTSLIITPNHHKYLHHQNHQHHHHHHHHIWTKGLMEDCAGRNEKFLLAHHFNPGEPPRMPDVGVAGPRSSVCHPSSPLPNLSICPLQHVSPQLSLSEPPDQSQPDYRRYCTCRGHTVALRTINRRGLGWSALRTQIKGCTHSYPMSLTKL